MNLHMTLQIPAAGSLTVQNTCPARMEDAVNQFFDGKTLPECVCNILRLQVLPVKRRLQNRHGFIDNLLLALVDLRIIQLDIHGMGEYVISPPDRLSHGLTGRNTNRFRCLRTIEIRAADLGTHRHAGKMRRLCNQISRRVLEGLRYNNQSLTLHYLTERAHHRLIREQVIAADIDLNRGELPGKAGQMRHALRQKYHRQSHTGSSADIIYMLLRIQLNIDVILCADL